MIGACQITSYLAGLNGTAILSSRKRVLVRQARPQDAERVRQFFRSQSPASRYNRFMTAVEDAPNGWIEQFSQSAHNTQFSLLASVFSEGNEIMIGEAHYAIEGHSKSAELALSVADDWQNDGLGNVLLKRLEAAAAKTGVMRLSGITLGGNHAMRRLFHKNRFQFKELCMCCLRFEKTLPPAAV